jgi:hypothetical protein
MTDVPPIVCESLEYRRLVPLVKSSYITDITNFIRASPPSAIHDWSLTVHITSGCKSVTDVSIVSVRENTPVTARPFWRSVDVLFLGNLCQVCMRNVGGATLHFNGGAFFEGGGGWHDGFDELGRDDGGVHPVACFTTSHHLCPDCSNRRTPCSLRCASM